MKKFFLFAAAIAATMTVNAEVRDFTAIASESDYTISAAGVSKNSGSTDTKIMYDLTAGNDLTVVFADLNATFSQKAQTSDKSKYFTVAFNDYVEVGGKGFELLLENVTVGDKVVFLVANKSDKGDGSFEAVEGLNGSAVVLPKKDKSAAGADEFGYTWVSAEFTATATDVKVTETMYGFRIKSVTIGAGQGFEGVNASVKAQKVFENGQLVIIKNGRRFNALGAEL